MLTKKLFKACPAVLTVALVAAVALAPLPSMAQQAKSAEKSAKALETITKAMTSVKTQVEDALTSLTAVTNAKDSKDLQSNFKDFSKRVDDMVKGREKARKGSEDFKAQREDYLKTWQKEMGEIQNPEIKATMEARQAKVTELMESVKPPFEAAKASFDPFMADLVDTKKMLSMDLTSGGVAAASPITSKTLADGKTVVSNIDTVLQALTTLKEQMK